MHRCCAPANTSSASWASNPFADALAGGADVVLAGRATDTASVAALALMRGLPPGPTWHAAKTVECGGVCTTNPQSGGGLVDNHHPGFTVPPPHPHTARPPPPLAAPPHSPK